MGDLAGRNLGPYRLLDQVGSGGMATVYKAYHAAMDRYVAIKVLPAHLARDPNFRARFEREARTIARLEHRYILPVYDVAEDEGIPYLVMRYTDSGDLASLIAGGRVTPQRVVEIVGQVAEALDYAHRLGVIHRDIKPANVLIGRDGDALLADFGIAKIYEDALQLTGEGNMVGTPAYMAPEQLQGKRVDPRTDIYALGVVLYQALTGEHPFVAETPLAVAMMHIHNPLRPPRQINPAIPEPIERIILRAMAKSPDDRFQDAGEMANALRAALAAALAAVAPPTVPMVAASVAPSSSPAAPLSDLAATAPSSSATPPPAPVAPVLKARIPRNRLVVAGIALAAIVLAALALWWLPGRSGQASVALPTGPTLAPRASLRVFANSSVNNNLAVLGDTVWAATTGGLARYSASGAPRVFSIADGLPFNAAQAIVAAPDGALWVGAYAGVARVQPVVDGIGAVNAYELSDLGQVYTFMIDADASIWLGGEYGVRRFDGAAWQSPLPPTDQDGQGPRAVQALLRDRDGTLWVGLVEGLMRWKDNTWIRYSDAQGIGQAPIHKLVQSRDGTIWAAAGGAGLLRYDAARDGWQTVGIGNDGEDVRSIVELADGRLLVSNSAAIAQLAAGGAGWTPLPAPDQYQGWAGSGALVQDSAGRIWVAAGAGVSVLEGQQWRLIEHSGQLPTSAIGQLRLAPDGKLWAIQSYGGVAATIDPASLLVEPFKDLDATINTVAFTQDTLWLGTTDGLVRRRGGATLRITTDQGLPSNDVRVALADGAALWIGTDKGLARYDLASESIVETVPAFDAGVLAILFRAPDGAIWAGAQRQGDIGLPVLGRFDGSAWTIWHEGDPPLPQDSSGVTAITADKQGRIWVGVWGGGLHTWDGAAWRSWIESDGGPDGNVTGLVVRGDDILAAGREGSLSGAIYRWNKDGWRRIAVDGLPYIVNDMLLTADGVLWLATDDGLLRIDGEGVAALQ